ncbi:MAG: isochorismatase family protein [Hyphomicrobiaceae bacterium]
MSVALLLVECLDTARKLAVPVIHVGVARPLKAGLLDEPRTATAIKSGKVPRQILPLAPGRTEGGFVLTPNADEEVDYKIGVSAFAGTETLLRNLGNPDVIVAGVFTHMAVESTVRHGFDLGFRLHVATPECCAPTRALHEASLSTGSPNFARELADTAAVAEAMRTLKR